MGLFDSLKLRKERKQEELHKQEKAARAQTEAARREALLQEVRLEYERERASYKTDSGISAADAEDYFQKALIAYDKDYRGKEAFAYFEKAALGGHPRAAYYLGIMYNGNYGPSGYNTVDFNGKKEAVLKWFTAAALLGHSEAAFLLGTIYHDDMQETENSDEYYALERNALKWCSAAADIGLAPRANYNIESYLSGGSLYATGNDPYIKKS